MKVALVNPPWDFARSIYFGCRHPHLPLELGYARALLERSGHDVLLLDGHLCQMGIPQIVTAIADFHPDMTVVTTAPTYLFWRCAPPELRVPRELLHAIGGIGGRTIAVGPHGSATPGAVLRKLGVDVVVRGECEEAIAELAATPDRPVPGTATLVDGRPNLYGPLRSCHFTDLPALIWPDDWVRCHSHHHHRFDTGSEGLGAEVEASRGCPYNCTFCAKMDFRDQYRRRTLSVLLDEIDRLIGLGVRYLYFIDEIFLPNRALLEALTHRNVAFGIQTRIDLWKPEMLGLLGRAGCVSIEAGVESLTEEGRAELAKNCRLSTDQLADLLILARHQVPFVQANLIASTLDDASDVARWRDRLQRNGVWANDPVPLYPYPSSPEYRRLWGEPDDRAWERAHAHYLRQFQSFSDIQDESPLPLEKLEAACLPV